MKNSTNREMDRLKKNHPDKNESQHEEPGIKGSWGPRELAIRFNVKKGTIYCWLSRGVELPPRLEIASIVRWDPDIVEKWIKEKTTVKARRNFEE